MGRVGIEPTTLGLRAAPGATWSFLPGPRNGSQNEASSYQARPDSLFAAYEGEPGRLRRQEAALFEGGLRTTNSSRSTRFAAQEESPVVTAASKPPDRTRRCIAAAGAF